jgi:hypothetical protein
MNAGRLRDLPRDRVARLLDAVYPEPNPLDTAESFLRAHHDDIAGLTLDELESERLLARIRWATLVYRRQRPSDWLQTRLWRLDRAAERLRKRRA